jgi:hypothetical protein
MSNKQLRNTIRVVHLIAGVCIVALVYSEPLRASAAFLTLMQFVVIPVVAISGIAMWQQAFLSRLRRHSSANASTAPSN